MDPNINQYNSPSATPEPIITPNPTPTPPPEKKNKGLLIGLIAGGAALLLAIIAVVVYFTAFSVTKADYEAAHEQMESVRDTVSIRPSLGLTNDPEETVNEMRQSLEAYKTENAKLKDLKALRADSELKEKYQAYDEKAVKYIAFLDGIANSLEKYLTAAQANRDLPTRASADDYRNLARVINENKDVSDPDLKKYLEKAAVVYDEIATLTERYETSSSSSERLSTSREIVSKIRELSTSLREMSDSLNDRQDAVDPRDEFNELGRAVTDKANQ